MRRVGIYSGTFDPIHNGHLGFALQAIDMAGLDEVIFIPEKSPRGKENVTDISHRFEIIRRAIEPYPELGVRLMQAETFRVQETLPELREIFDDAELFILLGSDVANTLPYRWDALDELFKNMTLVIGMRYGDSVRDIKRMLKHLDGVKTKPRAVFIESLMPLASSTRIRRGEVVRDMVPGAAEYIKQHKLYS